MKRKWKHSIHTMCNNFHHKLDTQPSNQKYAALHITSVLLITHIIEVGVSKALYFWEYYCKCVV